MSYLLHSCCLFSVYLVICHSLLHIFICSTNYIQLSLTSRRYEITDQVGVISSKCVTLLKWARTKWHGKTCTLFLLEDVMICFNILSSVSIWKCFKNCHHKGKCSEELQKPTVMNGSVAFDVSMRVTLLKREIALLSAWIEVWEQCLLASSHPCPPTIWHFCW